MIYQGPQVMVQEEGSATMTGSSGGSRQSLAFDVIVPHIKAICDRWFSKRSF